MREVTLSLVVRVRPDTVTAADLENGIAILFETALSTPGLLPFGDVYVDSVSVVSPRYELCSVFGSQLETDLSAEQAVNALNLRLGFSAVITIEQAMGYIHPIYRVKEQ